MPKTMLDQIIEVIFNCFKGDSDRFCESALQALGMVVRSMRQKGKNNKLSNELVFLVPSLFKGGLSHNLIMTLEVICKNIEEARGVIQSRLFTEVDSVLRNHTFQDMVAIGGPGSPNSQALRRAQSIGRPASQSLFQRPADIAAVLSSAFATTSKLVGSSHIMDLVAPTDQASRLVVLALHTLHTFDFYTKHQQGAHQVLKTIKESVINCLDDDDKYIRKSATVTCCKILHNSLDEKSELRKAKRVSSNTENTVLEVMERLLMVGVADDIEEIRLAVFQTISPRLDPYVAKSENLNCLLDAINDESVHVCSSAMGVIARLAYHSPTVIMPQLRKILVQLLRQLEHNDDTRLLENSIVLLTELIKGANLLLKPYIEAILSPLLMQLELEEVDAFAVAAIGELSMVDSACIVPHVDVLLSKIIKLIDEKGAAKKQTMALRALGQIVGTTGCVITPYLSHPDLLDGIISIIQKSDSVSHKLRCEATRAFGILGVADPNKLKAMNRRLLETAEHNGNFNTFAEGRASSKALRWPRRLPLLQGSPAFQKTKSRTFKNIWRPWERPRRCSQSTETSSTLIRPCSPDRTGSGCISTTTVATTTDTTTTTTSTTTGIPTTSTTAYLTAQIQPHRTALTRVGPTTLTSSLLT
jgi:FKBP12-rapamycin complex-associated protein